MVILFGLAAALSIFSLAAGLLLEDRAESAAPTSRR
jgi:hypothetical protein